MNARTIASNITLLIAGVFALLVIAFAAFVEIVGSMPLGWMYYTVAGGLILAAALIAIALRPRLVRIALTLAGCVVVVALLLTMFYVPWSSRKPFLADLNRVEVGMTEA
ncbi:MAG: hypothetical protein MI741_16125, partial [Rhodospirillales bacterium]|nr:hypothetical protein [Rhodospirillales bacterium]